MNNKSQTEIYWQALADKTGDSRTWNELRPQEQHLVMTSINLLLQVLQVKES